MSSATRRALLSVSDRTGLVNLARTLASLGFELVSTGGTAAHLAAAGLPTTSVSGVTGFPEVFDGRVKTLHPALFGGILFDRANESHRAEARAHALAPVDVVVVNLYPFEETLASVRAGAAGAASSDAAFRALIEKIDVGGPSLLRAAAKNHAHVAVLCDPADYDAVVRELVETGGALSPETRRRLAAKVFRRTAEYDAAIAAWLAGEAGETRVDEAPFPETLSTDFPRAATLRYGENPHQRAAFYRDAAARPSAFARFVSVQGKELSYNNLLDADAAIFSSRAVGPNACTIVKHRIASGIARGGSLADAFERAWASDPVAGFGGVVAFTGPLDAAGAEALVTRFLEVVVVHHVTDEARTLLARKPNLRVLTVVAEETPATPEAPGRELRGVDGGLLVQDADVLDDDVSSWRVATKRAPTDDERAGLAFSWRAVRGVLSNAIVVSRDDATVGIGGGRTSRVDACRDAVAKAGDAARGAVAASDAFFPFPDGLELLASAGVTAVVQPGGSVKDAEVVAAADACGLAMLLTGRRHFRH